MTLSKYDSMMEFFKKTLSECKEKRTWETCHNNLVLFQETEMMEFLKEYKNKIKTNAQKIIYLAFEYAVKFSKSGSSIVQIPDKRLANRVDEICWGEIGDFLLDYEVYEDASNPGTYLLDCMFAGNYVPAWDGWEEL